MATQTILMTTSEFAKAAGVPAAGISKLIRGGKLKAKKTGGKWMIPQSELGAEAVRALKGPGAGTERKAPAAKPDRTRSAPEAAAAPPVIEAPAPPEPAAVAPLVADPGPAEKTYTISEFAALTYLTEKGVAEWLKIGRIKGIQKENGDWRVLACNLQVPDISRLLRK
jgi:excisionase family DNA binding protein